MSECARQLLICLLLACLWFTVLTQAPSTLRQVNLVYRHGDRSPVVIYPNDPNKIDKWPQGLGWLSTIGMRQQYALGQYLRQRYSGFLNKTYIRTEIYIKSSNVDRTLMSAYSNLAGLYPPEGEQVWNPNINWQPIPVHTRPEEEDNKINLGAPCPKYDKLLDQIMHSDAVKKEERENKEFYKFVSEKSGVSKENISNIWEIADTLTCEKMHNMTLSSWVNETIYDKLRDLLAWSFDLMYDGPEMRRLKGGPLLKEIISNMESAMKGSQLPKVHMYSGHDTTVAALLSALMVYNKLSPPYASLIMVELHEENNQFSVEMFFKNSSADPYPLQVPGCAQKCPYAQFVSLTKASVPTNWTAECQVKKNTPQTYSIATIIALATACGVLVLLLLAFIAICLMVRRRSSHHYNRFLS